MLMDKNLYILASLRDAWDVIVEWFRGSSIFMSLRENFGFIVSLLIVGLIIIWLGERIIKFLTKKIIQPPKRSEAIDTDEYRRRVATALSVFKTVWRMFVVIIGFTILVAKLEMPLGPITTVFGAIGVALGFGAQSLVKDFINGLFIISENQYKIGDYVSIEGLEGKVEYITMRITVLRDMDGNVHYIPNSNIRTATNQTSGFSRMVVKVNVAFDCDLTEVEKVINTTGEEFYADDQWGGKLKEAPHLARVVDFEDSSISLSIWARTRPGNQWQLSSEFRKRLKEAFDKAKIKLG